MNLFFERLTDRRPSAVREAVIDNVQRIVASLRSSPREGLVGVYDFGLVCPTEMEAGVEASKAAYLVRLELLVDRLEPRLTNVRVDAEATDHMDEPFKAIITAEWQPGGEPETLHFGVN